MELIILKKILVVFFSLFLLTSCTQKQRDTISDITYALTGVPGAKHKEQPTVADKDREAKRAENERKFNARRDHWIGKSSDDLVRAWGSPTKTYDRKDGGEQLTWTWTQSDGPGLFPMYIQCTTNFIADKKGIIKEWDRDGCFVGLPE